MENILKYFKLVKFSHTIFAMPFALIGLFLAYRLNPMNFSWQLLIMVGGYRHGADVVGALVAIAACHCGALPVRP